MLINVKDIIVLLPVSIASLFIFVGIAMMIREVSLEEIKIFIRGMNPLGFRKSLEEEMSGKR